jgi:hypothetical protein
MLVLSDDQLNTVMRHAAVLIQSAKTENLSHRMPSMQHS